MADVSTATADPATLRDGLIEAGCEVPVPGSGSYAAATRLWNSALSRRPLLVARCRTTLQVSAAIRAARAAGVECCIHNGGQDWRGRSVRDGALLLDMSPMDTKTIDPGRREALIGGGLTAGRLMQAAAEQGLAPVIGNDGHVSVAGLMLGGGYGPLMTRHGLACDSLVSAELVRPDGEVVLCDADHEPDLFWAIRGGGGDGLGVLTAARVRLHVPPPLHAGTVIFPLSEAAAALAVFGALMLVAPDELFGAAILTIGPGGRPVIVISLVWSGDAARGREIVDEIGTAGSPVLAAFEPADASALLAATDNKLAQGRAYAVATRWLTTLAPEAAHALVAAYETRPSPHTTLIVHHCHGAATRVPPEATAFFMRRPHFTALIYEARDPADGIAPTGAWARATAAALDPTALPGGYAALLAEDDPRMVDAFGANGSRLAEIRRRSIRR